MPALDWITVRGFKSIAAIEKIRLTPINLIIGANGSGKSNFISAFSFLNTIREGGLQNFVKSAGGADRLLHFGAKTTSSMRFHISFSGEANQYLIDLIPTDDDSLVPSNESCFFWNKAYLAPYESKLHGTNNEAGISGAQSQRVEQYVRGHLDRWRLYHFHDVGRFSPIKKSAPIDDNRALRPDGSNLAAFLYLLREKHPASYALIRSSVQSVAPFFDDFVLEPRSLENDQIRVEWKHKGSDDYFDVSAFSDGTLRFIALATLFLQPEELRPSVIIVDEPELGLHPYAIAILASMAKSASAKTQIILSTQSALLLDHFEPEDVLVADRVEGGTILTRLDADKWDEWLEEYSLGQLWEKAEFGGRPGDAT
ncbi:AAA family ATPase [Sphingorhabdus sp.]|jgi:predicted ATPase|uniref:AAA family ATPase n=1 Tax=Sphingorhabdus sp. TaxID=1902408 RepID=UPI0037C6A560